MQAAQMNRSGRGSFSERAARDPALDYDDDLSESDPQPQRVEQRRPYEHGQNTSAHQFREPQAALHVPKPRIHVPEPGSPNQDEHHKRQRTGPPLIIPHERSSQPFSATNSSPRDRSNQSRRASLQERSPLQKLEDSSKEEKRARMMEAEQRARQRHANRKGVGLGGEKRHTSDGAYAPPQGHQRDIQAARRIFSEPMNGLDRDSAKDTIDQGRQTYPDLIGRTPSQEKRHSLADDGITRFSKASEELRKHNGNGQHSAHRQSGGIYDEHIFASDQVHNDNSRLAEQQNYQPHGLGRDRGGYGSSDRQLQTNTVAQTASGRRHASRIPRPHQQLQADRMGSDRHNVARRSDAEHDLVNPESVSTHAVQGPTYRIPSQTATSRDARDRVHPVGTIPTPSYQTGSTNAVHRSPQQPRTQNMPPRMLDEWRTASVAKLELEDLTVDEATGPRNSRPIPRAQAFGAFDGGDTDGPGNYQPALYVKCGPLLRYKGLRRERRARQGQVVVEREIWRGSVMIVSADQHSSYSAPTLRLFAQPADLLPPPAGTRDLPSDYDDPVAGEVKPSRTGQPLYVKPIESIPELVDLSQEEGDQGLFEPDRSSGNRIRVKTKDGEKFGKYKEVKGARLHAERGLTFWRFNIEVELGVRQARIAYRINGGPATAFWVPARGSTMNIMFHSCNGFSLSVDSNSFSGPDPLWRDVINSHAMKPYHVMLGGGDQVYNDRVMRDTNLFRQWVQMKNPEHKHYAEFTPEMQDELETFYLNRYCLWFSQGLFGLANSQIPMINLWDDHDIIDGYGSYPDAFMRTKVFTGLGAVAFKYYLLFQHQSVPAETFQDEPSWVLGAAPGPYIHQLSRSVFMFLGRRVALLGVDCRTERRRDEVLSQGTYDLIFNRCRAEIVRGETKHLIVLLTVPIAYPRLNFLENILTSRVMDPIKAIGRAGAMGLGGFVNKFDGGVEILDDLDDHWTAKHHKQERNWFIQELQALAAEKSVRITILGGDVHLGAIGQFYTARKLGHVPKDRDHRYMPNVVSSAIVNTPPPIIMSDILNKRNKVHHLDDETDEGMIPIFEHDVDGKIRKNKTLLPRRNYCSIREYFPGSTPPRSPVEESPPLPPRRRSREGDRRYPPGSMLRNRSPEEQPEDGRRPYPPGTKGRSRSLSRDTLRPRNLLRRLSGSLTRRSRRDADQDDHLDRDAPQPLRESASGPYRESDSYFPPTNDGNTDGQASPKAVRPSNMFHRRPTDLADQRRSRRGDPGEDLHDADEQEPDDSINLEYGLDICLNMEVSQQDPAGITVPYRLLVPALSYDGGTDPNTTRFRTRRSSLLDRIRGRNPRRVIADDSGSDSDSRDSESRSPSPKPALPARPALVSGPIHPDDRLHFADQQPPKDPRRDSRLSNTLHAAQDSPAADQRRILRKPVASQQVHQQSTDVPIPGGLASHAATAPLPHPGHNHISKPGNESVGRPSLDYAPTEELYASSVAERKKLGFFGSLKRRFSARRGGRARGGPDEYSGSEGMYSDSEEESEVDLGPGPRRPHQDTQRHGSQPYALNGFEQGPRYRASEELAMRNDGRVTQPVTRAPPSGVGRYYASNGPGDDTTRNSADRGPRGPPGPAGAHSYGRDSETFSEADDLDYQRERRVGGGGKADGFFGVGNARGKQAQNGHGDEDGGRYSDEGGYEAERPRRRTSLKFWKK